MMLLLLTCLLAIFPAVSTKSPIFGPEEVSSVEGNSVSIRCFYPATSVNRHIRKYWCRQGSRGICTTLVSSEGYISKDYAGRVNLTNFPEDGTFVVTIAQLTPHDSGLYKCGLGINNRGLSFDVSLEVSQGTEVPDDTHVYTLDLGRTVTISCPFTSTNSQKKKSLCKKTGESCELVVDSSNNVGSDFKDRANLIVLGTSKLVFNVTISHLKLSDTGLYVCQTGEDSTADKKNIDLQVLKPEPELLYGELRGSVTFDCALGQEVANMDKYLCRMDSEGKCNVVVNTQGIRDSSFEGRILLKHRNEIGHFSVPVISLRKEDAGYYQCRVNVSEDQQKKGWPIQAWQLFINEESSIPHGPSLLKGVAGGSVAIYCPYDQKKSNSIKYWCRWKGVENGHCPLLVESEGKVQEQYEGRLALFEEPGDGIYTVMLNQLTSQDAGFYWCLTSDDTRWRTTVELQVIEGKPGLKVPENVTAVVGRSVTLECYFSCKYYSYEKYWCRWSNTGCKELPSHVERSRQASVSCDLNSQFLSVTIDPVTKEDEGWYWCGMKKDHRFGETAAVYVAVEEVAEAPGSPDVSPMDAKAVAKEAVAPAVGVIENKAVGVIENKAIVNPRLFAEEGVVEDAEEQASRGRASTDTGSSKEQGRSSTALLSTLVPLGLVLTVGTVAVWVARARHRKNVDRISIRSYRTDISMSDFDNSRDFGAIDNMGASPVTQETNLEEKTVALATIESYRDPEESKKARRSSKEEAEMAYSAFLIQSSKIAAQGQNGPTGV